MVLLLVSHGHSLNTMRLAKYAPTCGKIITHAVLDVHRPKAEAAFNREKLE